MVSVTVFVIQSTIIMHEKIHTHAQKNVTIKREKMAQMRKLVDEGIKNLYYYSPGAEKVRRLNIQHF